MEFSLTEKEKESYENFSKNMDPAYLKGLTPISIAKLFVYADLMKDYDVHYALYTTRPDHILWTKEEDDQIPEIDRGTKESILQTYNGIQDGEFMIENDIHGWIKYDYEDGSRGFSMVKDQSGIWKVSFMPIQ
ncbi:RNA polymerase subunit sigma [Halobacillus sp. Nhm2S1]|nr:RNA polymerase subunit sigma [Halobacillus sp. Nhm2S1]